jgi:hypothetical protein
MARAQTPTAAVTATRAVDLMRVLRIVELERLLQLNGTFHVLRCIFELGQAVGICTVEYCYGSSK